MTFTSESLQALLEAARFDENGLIPAIAQSETGDVLMLAWMNRDALAETLATGYACYWSRSRKTLWRKGETSGQRQRLLHLRLDCDQDALLLIVAQEGVACHTGRLSCFYKELGPHGFTDTEAPRIDPATLYGTPLKE